MNGLSRMSRKGIVSGYFLAVFLLVSTMAMYAADNEMYRMKTAENLKIALQREEKAEEVLADLKCRLKSGEIIENPVILTAEADVVLTLTVYADEETKEIVSCITECRDP